MRRRLPSGWEIEALQRHIDQLLGDLASPVQPASGWSPAVDVVEAEDRYVARLDLPGLAGEDLQIVVRERELHISGNKRPDARLSAERRYHRMERGFGPFAIEIALPGAVDPSSTVAALRSGVLEVTMPRRSDRPHTVHIIDLSNEEP
ncbi:MAG: Hsp20/alpha crystallin family protein [Acidobacteriota bacterium]